MATEIQQVKSVCPYCGVGCGIVMQVADNQVVKVSGDKLHPANRGKLCTKGLTCAKAITAPGRLTHAFLRQQRLQEPVKTEIVDAIRQTAHRLKGIIQQHGADAVALYVSGQMSLEAQYLANKLAKGFISTRYIESNSRLCMASASSGYKQSLGADGPPGSYQDFEHADLFLVIGANMADCHPILFLRMMARVKAGAKLIVVDTRRTATAEKASLFLQVKSGSDLVLLNGLLGLLLEQGKIDNDFIAQHTQGWEQMPDFLADYPLDRVATVTGLQQADIQRAAQWLGEASAWMSCWTMGLNQSIQGTLNTSALCNLHLATGTLCRPGCGPFSLTGQPNAMGGREMGYMGPGLPGQRSLLSADDRHFTETVWGLEADTLSSESGKGTIDMFQQMAAGHIKACWIICTNPAASVGNRKQVIEGLKQAELVITQDAFLDTETNRYADILLPGALWAEGEGVMINSERNVTLMKQAVSPPGDALPDWQIIAQVACEMGFREDFTYASASDVFTEIQRFYNPTTGYDLRGMNYSRLSEGPIQWPSPPDDQISRHPIRYLQQDVIVTDRPLSSPRIVFPTKSGRAQFHCCQPRSSAEPVDDEYPFILNTGRLQHQWHTMTKTGKIRELNQLTPKPFVEIHPQDAERLNICADQQVELRSRRGHAILSVQISERVLTGHCFAPFHWSDVFGENLSVNSLTGDDCDPLSLQPALKYCAISITPIMTTQTSDTSTIEELPCAEATMTQEPLALAVELFAGELAAGCRLSQMLNTEEQHYLQGYLAGLRLSPPDARHTIPVLPATAPLAKSSRLWIEGMLAGLYARVPLPNASVQSITTPQASADVAERSEPVWVLWSSTTGNAESFAMECAAQLEEAGVTVQTSCLSAIGATELTPIQKALFVVSTFGDGDPPDSGATFWQMLNEQGAPSLAHLRFSVLAFGDRSYDQYCGFGRKLDSRLIELGATQLSARIECEAEDLHPARLWLQTMLNLTREEASDVAPILTTSPAPLSTSYDRDRPYSAQLLSNQCISGRDSQKETRQIILSLDPSEFSYQAGDALGVWPRNNAGHVEALITLLHLDPKQSVVVRAGATQTLFDALSHHFDLSVVSQELVNYIGERQVSGAFPQQLRQDLAEDLAQWRQLWVIDLLSAFPARVTAQEFIDQLRPLKPRFYSISSSPLVTPNEVHLTVSVLRDKEDAKRNGVCSSFLADCVAGEHVKVFVKSQVNFRPPSDGSTPLIMIGPGTGIAPFRAFLQHRQASRATGKNWLFFGEQCASSNYYYQQELQAFISAGVLDKLDTAFSRDQPEKIYVQHRMLQQAATLWQWLKDGAVVCVCGDASRMAKDVHQALLQIISEQGKMTLSQAEQWLSVLVREKRYLRDIY